MRCQISFEKLFYLYFMSDININLQNNISIYLLSKNKHSAIDKFRILYLGCKGRNTLDWKKIKYLLVNQRLKCNACTYLTPLK